MTATCPPMTRANTQLKTEHVKTEVKRYEIGGKISFVLHRKPIALAYTRVTALCDLLSF